MPLKRKKRVELLFFSKEKLDVKLDVSAAQKKVPPITLGDKLSGTAGQKTLRDAPVVVKLRR